MKLYDVPRNSKIKLEDGTILDFRHIDGMYSLCYYEGNPCHLAAWTEVEVIPEEN